MRNFLLLSLLVAVMPAYSKPKVDWFFNQTCSTKVVYAAVKEGRGKDVAHCSTMHTDSTFSWVKSGSLWLGRYVPNKDTK